MRRFSERYRTKERPARAVTIFQPIGDREIAAPRSRIEVI